MERIPFRGIGVWAGLWLAGTGSVVSESYNEWVGSQFTKAQATAGEAAPHADPDGDGVLNLMEYALGRPPRGGGPGPSWSIDPATRSAAFPAPADRSDALPEIECSADLATWQPAPPPVLENGCYRCTLAAGMPFLRLKITPADGAVIDSDGDGLHDLFEQTLLDSNPHDALRNLGEILPGDDFNDDGTPNLLDPANRAPGHRSNPGPVLIDPRLVAAALAARNTPGPAALAVHTPLD